MKDWNRQPAVAGRFYTDDEQELASTLDTYFATRPKTLETVIAAIAPHAGYMYSGRIAGEVYKRITVPDRVIILCPNHSGLGPHVSVWAHGSWKTPLGEVPVDEALAEKFLQNYPNAKRDREAHLYEHAIEVQVPFLQRKNPNVRIVPITLGPLMLPQCEAIGKALAECIQTEKTPILLVASTDMSHYIPAEAAKKLDALALDQVEAMNAEALYRTVVDHDISMCGFIPTTCVLSAATKLGAKTSKLIAYGNSGEATQDYKKVVAYASAWIK